MDFPGHSGGFRQEYLFRLDLAVERAGNMDRLGLDRALDDRLAGQGQGSTSDIAVDHAFDANVAGADNVPGDLEVGRNNGVLAGRALAPWRSLLACFLLDTTVRDYVGWLPRLEGGRVFELV